MTDQTISELLVLFLLAFSCARIFFHFQVRSDTLSILPLVSLIISVLNFFAWGISAVDLVVFLLAFFITIWNIRALLRLNAQLVIDHFGPLFTIVSIVNLVLVIAVGIIIFKYRPVPVNKQKEAVSETCTSYTGSFTEGFTVGKKPFQNTTARIWKYMPLYNTITDSSGKTAANTVVLFIGDKCANTALYRPFLYKLAHDGYTVYSAEFYAKDMRWLGNPKDFEIARRFSFCWKKLQKPLQYNVCKITLSENIIKEYKTFANLVFGDVSPKEIVVLAGDELATEALPHAKDACPIADDTFNIASVSGYTSAYGPVEQSEPLLAKILGKDRDTTGYMSAHLAHELEKSISTTKHSIAYFVAQTTAQTLTVAHSAPQQTTSAPISTNATPTVVTPTMTYTVPSSKPVTPITTSQPQAAPSVSVPATATTTQQTATVPASTTATVAAPTAATTTAATPASTATSTATSATPAATTTTPAVVTTPASPASTATNTTTTQQTPAATATPETQAPQTETQPSQTATAPDAGTENVTTQGAQQ